MKSNITENKLVNFVDKYLSNSIGELKKIEYDNINAREDDFELVNDEGITIFRYYDYGLGVEDKMYLQMLTLFNLNHRELENLLRKWFNNHYDGIVLTIYPIIE